MQIKVTTVVYLSFICGVYGYNTKTVHLNIQKLTLWDENFISVELSMMAWIFSYDFM